MDINTCSLWQLQTLPGIGPVKAAAIVQGREYQRVSDLKRVSGIGAATLDKFANRVRVVHPAIDALLPQPEIGKYRLAMMPVNSTGDCYHVLAFLLLCQELLSPTSVLVVDWFSDSAAVDKAVTRCRSFLADFGFTNVRIQPKLKLDAHYATPRQDAVHSFYQAMSDRRKETIRYIDIKAVTVLLAHAWRVVPVARTIIRDGFVTNANAAAEAWANGELIRISQYQSRRPMIVLHARFSHNTANPKQDIPDEFWCALDRYLRAKKVKVWLIVATSQKSKTMSAFVDGNRTSAPFTTHALRGGTAAAPTDFSKHGHLRLLHGLATRRGVLGVIGNTSGTLDAAAFLGARVLDLHTFKELDYQAARLFAQASLLDVQVLQWGVDQLAVLAEMARYATDGQRYSLNDTLVNEHLPVMAAWLKQERTTTSPLSFRSLSKTQCEQLLALYGRTDEWGIDQLACEKRFTPNKQKFTLNPLPAYSSFKASFLDRYCRQ